MIIIELNVVEFGGLKNKKIPLGEGLNVIFGSNESGKSTVMLFIKFMLYGLGAKKTGEPDRAYKRLYSYRRYVFENVSYEDAVGMFVDIYYKGDIDYEKTPYGALCIYEDGYPVEEVKLSGSDKKALKKEG